MFTGLIESVGKISSIVRESQDFKLVIGSDLPLDELALGDSVAVNGACLTVVEKSSSGFAAQASLETLRRTNLGQLRSGDTVNLERAMRLGDRLDGHLVLGHIDGVGQVVDVHKEGNAVHVGIEAPSELLPFIVNKGSIAVDGISLTVNVLAEQRLVVTLVPYTRGKVSLAQVSRGTKVNLEVDVLGKYVARLLETGMLGRGSAASTKPSSLSMESLRAAGFPVDD